MKKIILLLGVESYHNRTKKLIAQHHPHLTPFSCAGSFKQIIKSIPKNSKVVAAINRGEEYIETHSRLVDHYQIPGPSFSAVKHFRDKSAMHQLMVDRDLTQYRPQTKITTLQQLEADLESVQYPVVIKPFQGAKSRGIYQLHSAKDLNPQIIQQLKDHFSSEPSLKNKTQRKILIEEFVSGQQLTATAYVDQGGELHTLGFVDVLDGFDIGQNHHQLVYRTTPSHYSSQVKNKVKIILQKLVNISKLRSTFIHPDFIVDRNQIKLIELNVRLGGLRYELSKYAYEVNLDHYVLQLALDQTPTNEIKQNFSCTGSDFWSKKSGLVKELSLPQNKNLVQSKKYFKVGDKYQAPPEGNQQLIRYYVQSKNNDSLKIAKKIQQKTHIIIT